MTAASPDLWFPAALDLPALLADFRRARRRRIFLDYDGTLVDFVTRPENASPPQSLLGALEMLARSEENLVTVISGRSRADLERWIGGIPGLWLAAEHGAFLRQPGCEWRGPGISAAAPEWKNRIRPLLRESAEVTPGSFIEEKELCMVWHFRGADPDLAQPRAEELLTRLNQILSTSGITAIPGSKIVEVRQAALHKGAIVQPVMRHCGPAGFWLAAGDDHTDEDLFASMPPDSWTIHVGPGRSRARYSLAGLAQMNALLASMSASISTFT